MGTLGPSGASQRPEQEKHPDSLPRINPATIEARPASDSSPTDPGPAGEVDDRLIDAVLGGDTRAYGELVERHQDRLRNTLLRFTGSIEEAEDVAQEAFVQAYLKLATFQRSSRFYTWLYRIAFNLAVSKSRKRRPRVSLTAVQEAGGPEPVSEESRPDDPIHRDERARLLHQAIGELAEDHRQVLVLREFEELDYQQIAEVLDTPIGTVRSRLFRARMQLRDRLKETLQSD